MSYADLLASAKDHQLTLDRKVQRMKFRAEKAEQERKERESQALAEKKRLWTEEKDDEPIAPPPIQIQQRPRRLILEPKKKKSKKMQKVINDVNKVRKMRQGVGIYQREPHVDKVRQACEDSLRKAEDWW